MVTVARAAGHAEEADSSFRTVDALQALRAIAASLVVVDHGLISLAQGGVIDSSIIPAAVHIGSLGVYVFFAISGFVMVLSHENDFGRPHAPIRFLARRIGRVLPLHWITTLIMIVVRPETVSVSTLTLSLLLIPHQALGAAFGQPLFALAWTLQYELFFYLLFSGALLLPRRAGLALLAISLAGAVAAWSLDWLSSNDAAAYLAHPILLYFLAGLSLGILSQRLPEVFRPGFAVALLIAVTLISVSCASAFIWGADSLRLLLLTAVAPVAATAACGLSVNRGPDSRARQASRSLGDATYSIYMVHAFIVFPLGSFAAHHPTGVPWPLLVLLAVVLSAAAGLANYQWVERRLVKALGGLLGQKPRNGGRPL